MANAFLTPTAVTREALRVLHQKLNFVGTITREYDDSFARLPISLFSGEQKTGTESSVSTGKTSGVNFEASHDFSKPWGS